MAAEEEGGTVLEHLRAIESKTGATPQVLLDAPVLPDACVELWGIFTELHACRNSGFGPAPITFADIDAFQRVSGIRLEPWELAAIRRADAAYLESYAERQGDGR